MKNTSHSSTLLLIATFLFTATACHKQPCGDDCNTNTDPKPLPDNAYCAPKGEVYIGYSSNTNNLSTSLPRKDSYVAEEFEAIEIVESPPTGAALGWGWNRGDAEPIPSICVEFVPGEEKGQTSYMTMQEANDSYQLMKSMGMSAEASVKTIGYSGSAKAEFAKSQNINNSSSTFVLNAVVQNGVRYASPMPDKKYLSTFKDPTDIRGGTSGSIRLTPAALKLAKSSIARFKATCGSDFISAVYTGAKLTAMIKTSAKSKSEKQAASAEMSGSGTAFAAKIEADVKVAKKENTEVKSDGKDISVFMSGGNSQPIPFDRVGLLDALKKITANAYTDPKDFQVAITPYELVENWPGKTIEDKDIEFDELATFWGAYNTLYDEIQHVLDNPEAYADLTIDSTGNYQDSCTEQQKALKEETQDVKALEALKECVAKIDSYKLKLAQDEVLHGIKQMEKIAAVCSDGTELCEFNPQSFRSPYAFRAQLPIALEAGITTDAGVTPFKDFIDYKIGRIAKSRCEVSPNNSVCISNAEIDQWARKTGLKSIRASQNIEQYNLYASNLITDPKAKVKAGEAIAEKPVVTCKADNACGDDKVLCIEDKILWYNSSNPS